MVMDQFVTTYRKDYLWPYVRAFGAKPEPDHLYRPQYRSGHEELCACHCLEVPVVQERAMMGPKSAQQDGWSRLGPMGPLLDPKIYPARVGASPEVDTERFNQPNVFLRKLEKKYPYLYEILRSAPPDDIIARINRDRLRSTYQVDFCKMAEYPSLPYDELLRSAGVQGLPPCAEPIRLPGDPCRPNQRATAFRPTSITKDGGLGGFGKQGGGGDKIDKCAFCNMLSESETELSEIYDSTLGSTSDDENKPTTILYAQDSFHTCTTKTSLSEYMEADEEEKETEQSCHQRKPPSLNYILELLCSGAYTTSKRTESRDKKKKVKCSKDYLDDISNSHKNSRQNKTRKNKYQKKKEEKETKRKDTKYWTKSKSGSCAGGLQGVAPGLTEYQDAISRLGEMIIRDKIHAKPRPQLRQHVDNFMMP